MVESAPTGQRVTAVAAAHSRRPRIAAMSEWRAGATLVSFKRWLGSIRAVTLVAAMRLRFEIHPYSSAVSRRRCHCVRRSANNASMCRFQSVEPRGAREAAPCGIGISVRDRGHRPPRLAHAGSVVVHAGQELTARLDGAGQALVVAVASSCRVDDAAPLLEPKVESV